LKCTRRYFQKQVMNKPRLRVEFWTSFSCRDYMLDLTCKVMYSLHSLWIHYSDVDIYNLKMRVDLELLVALMFQIDVI